MSKLPGTLFKIVGWKIPRTLKTKVILFLGGERLFFKKMTKKERENTEKAVKVGFVFYMLALSVSSIYSFLSESGFNISFMILIIGLIVFFISDFIFNKITNK